jgi:tetratricopeptide (TPR) repeat protein
MMKKIYKNILIFFLVALLTPALSWAQTGPGDKDLLEKAKLELFDRHWDTALKKLNRLIKDFPNSPHYPQALFFKGKCLKEQEKTVQALEAYTRYLEISKNQSLREEATIALIDLNFDLYKKGEKQYAKKVIGFLKSSNLTVRYYAAVRLSHAGDKKIAEAAVPILKKIVAKERDEELVDRAKLALMRINPDHLKTVSKSRPIEARMLNIHIYHKKLKKETLSISIPFVLAKLALDSLPDKEKKELAQEGYDVDRLLRTLTEAPELLRIESEETIIKIWVE